jgi:hypothetical protein
VVRAELAGQFAFAEVGHSTARQSDEPFTEPRREPPTRVSRYVPEECERAVRPTQMDKKLRLGRSALPRESRRDAREVLLRRDHRLQLLQPSLYSPRIHADLDRAIVEAHARKVFVEKGAHDGRSP